MLATLYELSGAVRDVLSILDNDLADGEIPEALELQLDALEVSFLEKIDAILRYRATRVARAEGLAVELDRLAAAQRAEMNRAEWLKQYVFRCMLAAGMQKVETKLFKLWVQRNPSPSITLAGETIPDGYNVTKTVESLDSQRALADWKAKQAADEAIAAWEKLPEEGKATLPRPAEVSFPSTIRVVHGSHLRIK